MIVFGLVAISGGIADGQEGIVSWNSARTGDGYPVMRTNRELVPNERIEIEVVKGLQGLEIGISKPGEPWQKKWQPNDTSQGSTLSFAMTKKFQASLGVWRGLKHPEETSVTNAKDSTTLSYDLGLVILRVNVIGPGVRPAQASIAAESSPQDDKPAPERWEKVKGTDGKPSIRTKETAYGRKITIKAEKVVSTRYVTLGFSWPNASRSDYPAIQQKPLGVSDKPLEYTIPGDGLYLGFIQIGTDPRTPEEPKIKGFNGYDKLTFDDGTVFIVKIAK